MSNSTLLITDGINLLSALIRDRSITAFNRCNPSWFIADEIRVYQSISHHIQRYGSIPTVDVLARLTGFTLPTVTEPVSYYSGLVSDRAAYNIGVAIQARLNTALQSRNVEAMKELYLEASRLLNTTMATPDIIPISVVAESIRESIITNRFNTNHGIMTGYEPIDSDLLGLKSGELLTLVGRPKTGKTMYLIEMLLNAWENGNSVLFVSMEMSAKLVTNRILGFINRFNPNRLRSHEIDTFVYNDIVSSIRDFENRPPFNFVIGNFNKSVDDIRRYVDDNPSDLIAVDGSYLVTPSGSGRYQSSKPEQLASSINGIKALGEDSGTPVIITAQMGRSGNQAARGTRNTLTPSAETELEADFVHGSDVYAQASTALIGISRVSTLPNFRRMKIMAVRDASGTADMLVNYSMSPPDLSYVAPYTPEALQQASNQSLDVETREALL